MTEYFVEKLDYEDEKGITLAYELHKATLEENYDLDAIMQEYRTECEEAEEEDEPDTEEAWEEEEISDSLLRWIRKRNINQQRIRRSSGNPAVYGVPGKKRRIKSAEGDLEDGEAG